MRSVIIAILYFLLLPEISMAAMKDTTQDLPSAETSWQQAWRYLKGEPPDNTIYLGMWSCHLIDNDDDYETHHRLVGLSWEGYFGGAFRNSHGDLTIGVGIQRDLYHDSWGQVGLDAGYRLGLIYGYDNMEICDTGIFPLLQLYADLSFQDLFGIQFSWAGSVFTAGFLIRF